MKRKRNVKREGNEDRKRNVQQSTALFLPTRRTHIGLQPPIAKHAKNLGVLCEEGGDEQGPMDAEEHSSRAHVQGKKGTATKQPCHTRLYR